MPTELRTYLAWNCQQIGMQLPLADILVSFNSETKQPLTTLYIKPVHNRRGIANIAMALPARNVLY
jgi:hypothetical protein